jgi:hypothetical protein
VAEQRAEARDPRLGNARRRGHVVWFVDKWFLGEGLDSG